MAACFKHFDRVTELGQKVVIVSQWTSMLDLFHVHLKKLRIRCHVIAGNVTVKNRTAIVEDFNTNPKGPPVRFNNSYSNNELDLEMNQLN